LGTGVHKKKANWLYSNQLYFFLLITVQRRADKGGGEKGKKKGGKKDWGSRSLFLVFLARDPCLVIPCERYTGGEEEKGGEKGGEGGAKAVVIYLSCLGVSERKRTHPSTRIWQVVIIHESPSSLVLAVGFGQGKGKREEKGRKYKKIDH